MKTTPSQCNGYSFSRPVVFADELAVNSRKLTATFIPTTKAMANEWMLNEEKKAKPDSRNSVLIQVSSSLARVYRSISSIGNAF